MLAGEKRKCSRPSAMGQPEEKNGMRLCGSVHERDCRGRFPQRRGRFALGRWICGKVQECVGSGEPLPRKDKPMVDTQPRGGRRWREKSSNIKKKVEKMPRNETITSA